MDTEKTDSVNQIFDQLMKAQKDLQNLTTEIVITNLALLEKMWNSDGPYFQKALSLTKGYYSETVARQILHSLIYNLNEKVLRQSVMNELGVVVDKSHSLEHSLNHSFSEFTGNNPIFSRLDVEVELSPGQIVKTRPLGVITQILPGNNFINGVMAIVHSLLTKNAILLKPAQNEIGIIDLFLQSMEDASIFSSIKNAIAVISAPKHDLSTIEVIKQRSDAIVIWGREEAIKAYPQHECRGKVLTFGPKLGLGVVDKDVDLLRGAQHFAWEMAFFEQRACSSPRIIFIQEKDDHHKERLSLFAKLLNQELLSIKGELPTTDITFEQGAEILLHRERVFFEGGTLIGSEKELTHSVFVMDRMPKSIAEGYRIVYLVPFYDPSEIEKNLGSFKGYLQTAIVEVHDSCHSSIIEKLLCMGITQLQEAGVGIAGELGLPHEGEFMMNHFVRHCLINKKRGFFSCSNQLENH